MSSVLANRLDVHALNENMRKQMPAISNFMFRNYMGKCRSICLLFLGYLDREGNIFITHIQRHTYGHERAWEYLADMPCQPPARSSSQPNSSLPFTCLANLPQLPGQIRASSPGLRMDELPSRWPHLLLPCSINTIPEHSTAPGTESSGSWLLSNSTKK